MDDIAVIRSCFGDAFDHAPAIYLRNSGAQFPGRPCLGSWVVYGLGTENQNLPSFVVMSDGSTKSGPPAYSAGFLPAVYQGTVFRGGDDPILYLRNPEGVSPEAQRETLNFIGQLDKAHDAARPGDSRSSARASYELAFRTSAAPEAVDFARNSGDSASLWVDSPPADFGRKCCWPAGSWSAACALFQIYSGSMSDGGTPRTTIWWSHEKMAARSAPLRRCLRTEGAGLLDSTLVVWSGEFGRTPLSQGKNGRDHHPYGFTMWMAGAGIRGGQVLGATDEFGVQAVDMRVDAHDVNATLLRVMGLDHEKLTYFYQGRDQRLTDVHGQNEFTRKLMA
jgi:hypothetical protein